MNSEVKELRNALVTIKGNALRCGNNIYSIHNIVSLTFDSVVKERETPVCVGWIFCLGRLLKYLLFIFIVSLPVFFILKHSYDIDLMKYLLSELNVVKNIIDQHSFLSWIAFGLIFIGFNEAAEYENNKYYYLDGIMIVFVNHYSLFLVSNASTGFVKKVIDHLYSFISNHEHASKNELIINFSDSSININEAVSSNIIGGSVQGDVKNG